MQPWVTLASVLAPGGTTMTLVQRGDTFVIRVDKQELMTSRTHGSEEALAELTCEGLGPKARVLIGGLGMGYTLRAALDRLPKRARVDVSELVPEVVDWNRGVLGRLAKRPMEDRRTHIIIQDVTRVIAQAPGLYDAILLDTDNGPIALSAPGNANLYGEPALLRAKAALTPTGVFAVWSAGDSSVFHKRLERVGFDVQVKHIPARGDRGGNLHVIWLARHPGQRKRERSRDVEVGGEPSERRRGRGSRE